MNNHSNYINPNNIIKKYPKTVNNDSINRKDNNINLFMQRSLDTFNFIENNNSKNIWKNPIHNNSFTNNLFKTNEVENSYLGISTRRKKKLEETELNSDLHLKRSMLQPDFRTGNRFFEYKPTNTRRDNYKDIGNQNAIKFQISKNQF